MQFTIKEICQALGSELVTVESAAPDIVFSGISTDTRTVKPGDLFVALIGERFNGHDFLTKAVASGAAGLVVQDVCPAGPLKLPVITVGNTLNALQNIARFHRLRYSIPVIAITGSNGKTTTKDMTAAILASRRSVLKTQANYNNEIGLPLTLLNLTEKHEAAVVEMGMRGLGEIKELAGIALPTVGVITNVGETHMELLGSLDNIAAAKAELVEAIPPEGLIVLNADNPYVLAMAGKARGRVLTYGLTEQADIRASEVVLGDGGSTFTCHVGVETFPVTVPALGRHNVFNALAAISVGSALGLQPADIQRGLAAFETAAMRLAVSKVSDYVVINDAYNASPASMAAAVDTLVDIAPNRAVAVLGDMLELGDIAVEAHRHIGRRLANSGTGLVVTVGELAGEIAGAAREHGVQEVFACRDHAAAKQILADKLRPGDTILIKGSRGMKMEQILEILGNH